MTAYDVISLQIILFLLNLQIMLYSGTLLNLLVITLQKNQITQRNIEEMYIYKLSFKPFYSAFLSVFNRRDRKSVV